MAAPSQEGSTPFKDSVSSYIRGYWKKVIQEEGDKTIVAYTELIRQFDKNMASISHQISTEVAEPALASQIIGEEILSIQDFLAPNSNRIGPSEGPAKSLPADILQATVKAKKKTYIIPGLPAALDFRVGANASRGTRASTQIPLDSPKTTTTRDARATRASTQKLPDTSPKRLNIHNLTAFTKPAPNPVVPSSTPSTTKPPTARQPIKRRRTKPTDSFPRPPSKPKVSTPTTLPPHNPSTTMDTNPPPLTSPPCQTRPPPPPPPKARCTGLTSRTARSFSSTLTGTTTPAYATASTAAGGTGSARTRLHQARPSGIFNHKT